MYSINRAIINAFFSTFAVLITLFLDLTLAFLLIHNYGLMFNGFVRVTMLLIILVGTTETAISATGTAMLYRPLRNKQWFRANHILNTINNQHRRLAISSLIILILVMVIYGTYITVIAKYIQGNEVINNKINNMPAWTLFLTMLLILTKNYFSMIFMGGYSTLIKADQNQYIVKIVTIISELVVFGFVFWLLNLNLKFSFISFLPLTIYSFIWSGLIYWYVRYHYPWLKLESKRIDRQLVATSKALKIKNIAYGMFFVADTIIISILLGLQTGSELSFFLLIATFLQGIYITIIRAFKGFYGSLFAYEGRLHWKNYQKIEFFCLIIVALTFVTQFTLTPYLINGIFGNLIKDQGQSMAKTALYKLMFFTPNLSLLTAGASVLFVLIEMMSLFIDAKSKANKIAWPFFWLALTYITTAIVIGGAFWITRNYNAIIFGILSAKIVFLLITYGYFWIFNWRALTYNSWLGSLWQTLILVIGPIVTAICYIYLIIMPTSGLSYAAVQGSNKSEILKWNLRHWIAVIALIWILNLGNVIIFTLILILARHRWFILAWIIQATWLQKLIKGKKYKTDYLKLKQSWINNKKQSTSAIVKNIAAASEDYVSEK